MNQITQHSELITALVTIVAGAILRAIEKRKMRKKENCKKD